MPCWANKFKPCITFRPDLVHRKGFLKSPVTRIKAFTNNHLRSTTGGLTPVAKILSFSASLTFSGPGGAQSRAQPMFHRLSFVNLGRRNARCRHPWIGILDQRSASVRTQFGCELGVAGLPASTSAADAILILGGDGTVHRHLAQLHALQLPVLVVPCGSGNDFARALKLRRVRDSVDAWRRFCSSQDNVRQIDLGVISRPDTENAGRSASTSTGLPHYFCCVGGVGLDVEIARRANRLPRWIRRRGGYSLSLLPALLGFEPPVVRLLDSPPDSPGALVTRHDGPRNCGRVRQRCHLRRRHQNRPPCPTRRRQARRLRGRRHDKNAAAATIPLRLFRRPPRHP